MCLQGYFWIGACIFVKTLDKNINSLIAALSLSLCVCVFWVNVCVLNDQLMARLMLN